jgi:soluble lytic murein transglycosylase
VTLQWASQYGNLPVDLFVESLPYKETRAYVKSVVADLYLYQLFYGAKADSPRLAMTLPSPAGVGIDF